MSRTIFTSDLHWGHENIIRYCMRGYKTYAERRADFVDNYNGNHEGWYTQSNLAFKSPDDMNHYMVLAWNEVVTKDDIVYVLGDWAMADKLGSKVFFDQLNFKQIHLIYGNHDCNDFEKGKLHPAINQIGFDSVQEELYAEIDGRNVWMAHIPYGHDNDKRNYLRPKVKPGFSLKKDVILSGHVHDKWLVNENESINVGVDLHDFRPKTLQQLLDGIDGVERFDSSIYLPV